MITIGKETNTFEYLLQKKLQNSNHKVVEIIYNKKMTIFYRYIANSF